MPLDPTTIAVGAALLVAAFVKGTTGFGFPLIATPMVALLLDIRIAITILILPNILMDVAQIFRGSFPGAIIQRFKWLLLLTVLGVFLGTKVLVMLPLWALNLSLGVMVLVFVVSNFFRFELAIPPRLERVYSPAIGLAVGFLNGMTNAAGPVLASYLYSLKLPKTEFVRSISTIFMITKISQLAAVSTWNLFTFETLRLSAGVTVFVMLGFYFGLKTQERVNQKTFNRGLLVILFAIGVMLVVRGLR
jgi:uncharacterized membrane protein YfcA